jgi:uncharacterized phage infection (PIP) family protein YhgE
MQEQSPVTLEDNRPTTKHTVPAPGLPDGSGGSRTAVIALVVAIVALLASLGGLFFAHTRVQTLSDLLDRRNRDLAAGHESALTTLSGRLDAHHAGLETAAGAVEQLERKVKDLDGQLAALSSDTNNRLAELDRSVKNLILERIAPMEEHLREVDDRLKVTREEFQKKQDASAEVVERISKDSEFIIGELGKKAEKAYLTFMERKLKKQISEVADDVSGAKEEFRTGLADTQQKLTQLGRDIDRRVQTSVRKEVRKENTIDFEPAEKDAPPADDDDDDDDDE